MVVSQRNVTVSVPLDHLCISSPRIRLSVYANSGTVFRVHRTVHPNANLSLPVSTPFREMRVSRHVLRHGSSDHEFPRRKDVQCPLFQEEHELVFEIDRYDV